MHYLFYSNRILFCFCPGAVPPQTPALLHSPLATDTPIKYMLEQTIVKEANNSDLKEKTSTQQGVIPMLTLTVSQKKMQEILTDLRI